MRDNFSPLNSPKSLKSLKSLKSFLIPPEIGFGKTLPFGRVFYWVREREKIKGSQLGYWKVS